MLELCHRRRARVEDRIRAAKQTGLRNLPFADLAMNTAWLQLVLIAQDLLAWTQALLLEGELRRCEPKRLRYRLLHVAARLTRTGRRVILHLPRSWPWRHAPCAVPSSACAHSPPHSHAPPRSHVRVGLPDHAPVAPTRPSRRASPSHPPTPPTMPRKHHRRRQKPNSRTLHERSGLASPRVR
jgi:hypothetical protein